PGRAPAQLQPQVLPALAPPLLLLRALGRPAARGTRLPPRRVAPDAAGPLGPLARPHGAMRRLPPLPALLALLLAPAGGTPRAPNQWPAFRWDPPQHNASPESTIAPRSVTRLDRRRVRLD